MAGILHSLRALFGPTAPAPAPGRRTRAQARREAAAAAGEDDDVFSTFGDDDEEGGARGEQGESSGGGTGEEEGPESQEGNAAAGEGGGRGDDGEEGGEGAGDSREARRRRRSRLRRRAAPREEEEDGEEEEETEPEAKEGGASNGASGGPSPAPQSGGATATSTAGGNNGGAGDTQGNAPDGEAAGPSPLAAFFSHLPPDRPDEGPPSLQEWKNARKKLLEEYLARRLVGDDDDDDDDEMSGGVEGGDGMEVWEGDERSFSSEILDEPFDRPDGEGAAAGESQPAANSAADGANEHEGDDDKENRGGDNEESDDDDDDEMAPETQTQTQAATPRPSSSSKGTGPGTEASAEGSPLLETQAATQPAEGDDDNEMEEMEEGIEGGSPLRTQQTDDSPGLLGGLKRKLGFASPTAPGNNKEGGGTSPSPSKRSRTQSNRSTSRTTSGATSDAAPGTSRGLPWDGRPTAVPHVQDADGGMCASISDVDLRSGRVDLALCRVVRVWGMRSTRRVDETNGGGAGGGGGGAKNEMNESVADAARAMAPFERWEDDGPLSAIYKRVLSVEVVQIGDATLDDHLPATSGPTGYPANAGGPAGAGPSLAAMARAAFPSGHTALARAASRKRRRAARSAKLFFYDRWADAVSLALQDVRSNSGGKKGSSPQLLLSLAEARPYNVHPLSIAAAGCNPRLARYTQHPFGDAEHGTLSPYCVCLGDVSAMKIDGKVAKFHGGRTAVRLAVAPGKGAAAAGGEAVLTPGSVTNSSKGYRWDETGKLGELYEEARKRTSITPETTPMDVDDEEGADENGAAAVGVVGSNENAEADGPNDDPNASAGAPAPAPDPRALRPPTLVPLANLLPLLERNGMQRLGTKLSVSGVVLGFAPPSRTRSNDWKMSIVLIDESLPLSHRSVPPDNAAENGTDDGGPHEAHVPSTTLVLFAKDRRMLPAVRAAGDVVFAERATLQEWNGAAQLMAQRWSKVVVLRPKEPRRPGDARSLEHMASIEDWAASCSCHAADGEFHDKPLKYREFVAALWRWGQCRLAENPTVAPRCRLTVAGIPASGHRGTGESGGREESMAGDLTAAVTAVVPVPEHLRRRDTPRGYLRLWDGTGPSRADPLPLGPTAAGGPNPPRGDDPPEQVLVEIERIVNDLSLPGSQDSGESDEAAIRAPVALCGRVVNAIIWEEDQWNLIRGREAGAAILDVGSFVRLRNVNSAALPSVPGGHGISVHTKSSLTPLPFDAYEVRALLQDHDARVRRGDPTNPASAILPASSGGGSAGRAGAVREVLRNHGLSVIQDCLDKAPPATFKLQFEVSNTIPACDVSSVDALEALCATKKDGAASFRFALHIKDASSGMDVLCLGKAAETMLGVAAREVAEKDAEKCEAALGTLKEMMLPGSVCEGNVRSTVGKDGKQYFLLESMLCIPPDDDEVFT